MSELEINPIAQVQQFKFTVSLSSLTKFVKVMLFVFICTNVLVIISDMLQMNLLLSEDYSQATMDASNSFILIFAILNGLVYLVLGIAFLIWIYKANKNCHGFGAQGMKFSPGWSIAWYFIPIVSLFKPYSAMKEIWQVSSNPLNWQNESSPVLLRWWWALWLIAEAFSDASLRLSRYVESMEILTVVDIIAGIAAIPLCLVAITLVHAIYSKQERLVQMPA